MVEIKGLEKFAPKDFPGYISSTVFLGGCNFRCPFCQNVDLVLRPQSLPSFPLEYFKNFLDERKNWLEAVCITGGEPLIHRDLVLLLQLVKERGLLVKLDTNGSYPSRLEEMIQRKLVDHVAMDIKAPVEKYAQAAGVKIHQEKIQKSISLIRESGLDYTFRTTVIPGLIEEEDMEKIGQMLKGAKCMQIQQFAAESTLDESYRQKKPYSGERLHQMAQKISPYFDEVKIEGV